MSQPTITGGGAAARIVPVALALVVGLGAAGAATAAVVNSFSPDDAAAYDTGPVEPRSPEELLGYGE